jgi:hypothetical protein
LDLDSLNSYDSEITDRALRGSEENMRNLQTKRISTREDYLSNVTLVSKYLKLFGMIEVQDGLKYKVYNTSVNSNIYDWKK